MVCGEAMLCGEESCKCSTDLRCAGVVLCRVMYGMTLHYRYYPHVIMHVRLVVINFALVCLCAASLVSSQMLLVLAAYVLLVL